MGYSHKVNNQNDPTKVYGLLCQALDPKTIQSEMYLNFLYVTSRRIAMTAKTIQSGKHPLNHIKTGYRLTMSPMKMTGTH